MAYLVTCTFDLKNATRQDYAAAYEELASLGLLKVIKSDGGGEVVAPTTMTIGTYDGESASAVRTDIRDAVKNAFASRRFSSEIFVTVGGGWAWGAATT